MRALRNLTAILLSACFIVGCDPYNTPNENIGIVTGAVAGGLLGSTIGGGTGQAVAIGVGAVGGALLGGAIGRHHDEYYGYGYEGYGPGPGPEYYGY